MKERVEVVSRKAPSVFEFPKDWKHRDFDTWKAAAQRNPGDGLQSKMEALAIARRYSRQWYIGKGNDIKFAIVFGGPVGSGKSGLAFSTIKVAVAQGIHVSYIDYSTFISQCFSRSLADKESEILRLAECQLLVLDDLGNLDKLSNSGELRRESPDASRIITEILGNRFARHLPTIITTNLSISGIETQLGERLASRMSEACHFVWVGERDMRRD